MVRHAHAKEDKELRREAILAAALALFCDDARRLPAVAAIADRTGLAKGTIYLYFRTKEEIFAALLSQEWDGMLQVVEVSFAPPIASPQAAVSQFTTGFTGFLAERPYFLRLDAMAYGQLEANLPLEKFWLFKLAFSSALARAADCVDRALSLAPGKGLRLLVCTYALTRGLWQTLDLPDRLDSGDRLRNLPLHVLAFEKELQASLEDYWRGALDLHHR